MKYGDAGFRAVYRHFLAVPLRADLRGVLRDFPGAEEADCLLAYGYADREAGLTLEVMAAGRRTENGFDFADGNEEVSAKIRIGDVREEEVFFLDDEDGRLAERYAGKLGMLRAYDAPEAVERTRGMTFLDESRDAEFVDDVLVYLLQDGSRPESCWVRITGIGDRGITGILLNEPYQDLGVHAGGTVSFLPRETEDGRVVCCAEWGP